MPLKAFLKTLEGLDETTAALYREVEGGGYILDVESSNGFVLEDISGLKTALEKVKDERDKFRDQVRSYKIDEEPLSAEDAIRAVRRVKELEKIDPDKLADEKVRAKLEEQNRKHETELSVAHKARDDARSELEEVLVVQAATSAIHERGGNLKLLLPHVKSQVRIVRDDNGKPQIKVVDDSGTPRLHVEHGRTSDLTVDQLVGELSESDEFMAAFNPENRKQGSGQRTTNNNSPNRTPGHVSAEDLGSLKATKESDPINDIASGKLVVDMGN